MEGVDLNAQLLGGRGVWSLSRRPSGGDEGLDEHVDELLEEEDFSAAS